LRNIKHFLFEDDKKSVLNWPASGTCGFIPCLDSSPAKEYLKHGGQHEERKETRIKDVKTKFGVVIRNNQTVEFWHFLDFDAW
jgi:hypothetical protein